jgi:type I restriction enzyme R subunit
MSFLDEEDIELNALDEFTALGWETCFGPDISKGCADDSKRERDEFDQIFLERRLRTALARLNPGVAGELIDEAVLRLGKAESQNLMRENLRVHRLITEGCPVEYRDDSGETRGVRVRYIDFDDPENNDFVVVNQFALKRGPNSRRMDLIGFVNGIPLTVFELKSPTKRWATTKGAFRQLGTYQREFPELFAPCAIQVIGDGLTASAGTVGASLQHFAPWKTIDSEDLAPEALTGLQVLIRGMFDKRRFLDLVRNFVSFVTEDVNGTATLIRKGAKYHQFWAVNSALEAAVIASADGGDGRGGIVWHTQGSGKSLEMLFLAGKLMRDTRLRNPTVVMLTDRNDLDDQLFYEVFSPDELLPEKPVQADSADHMRTLLKRPAGGIVFTTIQKFRTAEKGGRHALLSDRRNIIVVADEAHRTQYDLIDGFARHLRDALPNATFIGFTGTPIDAEDRSTREIFGDYVSVYDLTRAVNDGATVRIFYESRLAKVSMPEEARKVLDEGVDEVLETEEDVTARENAKSRWARQVAVVGAAKRIKQVAEDLVAHWEQRSATQVGKAMVVCMSRQICVDLYDEIVALRPAWHDDDPAKGKVKVVITGSANDPEELVKHAHSRDNLRLIKRRAKKVLSKEEIAEGHDELEIVIVRDMWLTGFDAPVMNTMYVDKPMKGHSLMQAIARVNRTFRDKEGGLIVDYIGIATNLREAVAQYTKDDQDKAGIDTVEFATVAIEKHDIVKGILAPTQWSSDPNAKREDRIATLQRLVQHVLSDADRKQRFLVECRSLLAAFSIAGARDEVRKITDDVNLFAAVYGQVAKTERTASDGEDRDEALDTALKQLVSEAVAADGVIDVFGDLGLPNPELSVLSPEFLEKVRKGEQTNLQFELMKKVLNDKLRQVKQKNIVEGRRFSEMLERSILELQNRSITTAQAIQQLIELAEEINQQSLRGDDLGLTSDEVAFYDAITQNGSAVLELGDEVLRELTHKLVETVTKKAKLDWTKREAVRAEMRAAVKRLLRKYKYPPDRQESAVSLVIEQAELFAHEQLESQ